MRYSCLLLTAILACLLLPVLDQGVAARGLAHAAAPADACRCISPRMPLHRPTHAAASAHAAACLPPDSVRRDSLQADTLREVEVRPDSVLPVMRALEQTVGRGKGPRTKSLGDIIEKVAPGLNDKITHPFAIKQRKAERRKRKMRKALEEYDRARSFNDLLDEAVRRQQVEDERARREAERGD